jgi:uncharacterized protein
MPSPFEVFFLPVDGEEPGQRFCIFHPAQGKSIRGAVLYIHPFAEEMNKSRRMAALQSRALAKAGFAVLQIDLLGCGDSSGDFGDATWQDWVDDVVRGAGWLAVHVHQHHGTGPDAGINTNADTPSPPLWLWGLRAGCLLATEAAVQLAKPCGFLFWAPTPAGKVQLQQFLRLKAAGDMLGSGTKGVTEGLRKQLAAGSAVEVAGYSIAPALALGLEHAVLDPPRPAGPGPQGNTYRVVWFELSTRDDASLSPVAQKAISAWRQGGMDVQSHIVNGPSFWQTTEIEDAPGLLGATVAALTSHDRPFRELTAT